jgi:hypothetical protein
MKRDLILVTIISTMALFGAQAGDVGHFVPGVFDIRDYFVPPDPGVYGALYNYYYRTQRLNDNSGDKITTGPLGAADIDMDLKAYVFAPALVWATPWKVLGAKYAAYIAPTFADANLDTSISTAFARGGRISSTGFAPGDLLVQPVWLDWALDHWDLMLAYAFYAPVGKYHTTTFSSLTVPSPNSIGLGYWTQQPQAGVAWYPWTNHATAVTTVLTYEFNGIQQGTGTRAGEILTLNWGVSQYLPLTKDQHLLLEVGPAGYDAFQTTDTTGSLLDNPNHHSQVQAVGGQVGLTYKPWDLVLDFHGFYEYTALNRVQGASFGINLIKKF